MNKRLITIVFSVLGVSLLGLIFIQASYLNTAFELKKAQFNHAVTLSLDEAVKTIELNDKQRHAYPELDREISSISEDLHYSADGVDRAWRDQIKAMIEHEEQQTRENYHQSKDELFNQIRTNNLKNSITRSSLSTVYDLILKRVEANGVRTLEERLEGVDLIEILGDALKNNGINDHFEYAIKENNSFVNSSANFFNRYSEYNYCKSIFFDEKNSVGSLHITFPHIENNTWASVLMISPSIVLTTILVICFGICIVIILRQKKLSAIKNDFINNMTHEFKTPIATISLASQMLKDGALNHSPDNVDRIAGIIRDESKRLTFQVEKVLQTALFTESRMKLKRKHLNLNDVVENMVSKFALRIEDKGGTIVGHFEASSDEVFVDEVHISNVISNLLDNAIKYCAKQPEIIVYTRNKGTNIVLSVIDNGIGIPPNEQKMIFERFYRVSTGNLHDVKGFGLGLSYVKTIIESHHGSVEVESAEGKGSRFDIILPLSTKKNKNKRTLFF